MRRTPKYLIFAILFTLVCFGSGCSSTGSGDFSASSVPPSSKRVVLRPNTETRAAELMPDVTTALHRAGFTVVSEGFAPYEVSVAFAGGGWDLTCSIVMYRNGVPTVSGKGVNPGFGVWLTRDLAYKGVFRGALKQFEKRLGTH